MPPSERGFAYSPSGAFRTPELSSRYFPNSVLLRQTKEEKKIEEERKLLEYLETTRARYTIVDADERIVTKDGQYYEQRFSTVQEGIWHIKMPLISVQHKTFTGEGAYLNSIKSMLNEREKKSLGTFKCGLNNNNYLQNRHARVQHFFHQNFINRNGIHLVDMFYNSIQSTRKGLRAFSEVYMNDYKIQELDSNFQKAASLDIRGCGSIDILGIADQFIVIEVGNGSKSEQVIRQAMGLRQLYQENRKEKLKLNKFRLYIARQDFSKFNENTVTLEEPENSVYKEKQMRIYQGPFFREVFSASEKNSSMPIGV